MSPWLTTWGPPPFSYQSHGFDNYGPNWPQPYRGRGFGGRFRGRALSRGGFVRQQNLVCHLCKEEGHFVKGCPKLDEARSKMSV